MKAKIVYANIMGRTMRCEVVPAKKVQFAIKMFWPDGTISKVRSGRKITTWDDAGSAESYALRTRDAMPKGGRTKVVVQRIRPR